MRAGDAIHELLNLLTLREVVSEPFDLGNEILGFLAVARVENELHVHTDLRLEEGLPPVVAKRTHVQKVLGNLLYNSVEAMQEAAIPQPEITIVMRAEQDGKFARVTIQDRGPGVPQQDVDRLFEPFFTTKQNGMGMGLAISRSLIEASGGRLWAETEPGSGTAFHFTLPLAA